MKCTCPYTDPKTWLSAASCGYGSGYEPGSMQEYEPTCPEHGNLKPIITIRKDRLNGLWMWRCLECPDPWRYATSHRYALTHAEYHLGPWTTLHHGRAS